jgi:hypothetical protein
MFDLLYQVWRFATQRIHDIEDGADPLVQTLLLEQSFTFVLHHRLLLFRLDVL